MGSLQHVDKVKIDVIYILLYEICELLKWVELKS